MKVLHISSANSETGAGIACIRLHNELIKSKIDSKILFLKEDDNKNTVNYVYFDSKPFKKIKRITATILDKLPLLFYPNRKNIIFSPGMFGLNLDDILNKLNPEIIHFHWINHGFVDLQTLTKYKSKKIIFTMHDCWLFTGGCHHFFQCIKFKEGCGKCPALKSDFKFDISNYTLNKKKNIFNKINVEIVAISKWMYDNAINSKVLKNNNINIIPSGIDTNIFKYKPLHESRSKLNFGLEDVIIVLGAQSLNSDFKGIDIAINAIENYKKTPILLITIGSGKVILKNSLHTVMNMGFINDPTIIANIYSTANLFLSTSIAEGFGMMVAEAQCCGTPTLAFKNTGSSDIIEHQESGFLSEYNDNNSVLSGIEFCLTKSFNRSKISEETIKKFSIEISAKKYINIYNSMSF
jgi:glycosyltransferase involved in cell wall biosynthesis